MQWDDSLAVGVGLIDEQHKQLIKRLDDLAKAVGENQGPTAVASTLSFLSEYAEYHFREEEAHMAALNYPGLAEQQAMHQEFRAVLKSLDVDFETDGASEYLAKQVNTFLIAWLAKHIQQSDSKFGKFLQDQGVELT
jgi:hemerythrin